jgi:Protein of unknown function (DUF3891)
VLVCPEPDGALVIGQLSHAWLSGQLARAWGNTRFGSVEPREEIVLGACQHDIGWALFDLHSRLSRETGLPESFMETTVDQHIEIWADAPDHLLSQSLCAALVVSLHGCALSELRARGSGEQIAGLQEHIATERVRQAKLRGMLGLSAGDAERIQRQMWTWDSLSLALCNAWRSFTAHRVPSAEGLIDVELQEREDGVHTLDPWPFCSQQVEVRCEARRLEGRYDDETTMREALRGAAPVTLRFVLAEP